MPKNLHDYKDVHDMSLTYNNVHFYKDDIINYNKSGYKDRYYKFYNITNKTDACKEYISGLYWILGYYENHIHDNWSWHYTHDATPFATDIFTYLLHNNMV